MRLAVVGAGRWGYLHAQKLSAMSGVELVAVVDRHQDAARAVALEFGVPLAVSDVSELPSDVVAATVAVNIDELGSVSRALLNADCHVFVEKPGATSIAEAEGLVTLSIERELILAGGFIERFNPVMAGHRGKASRIVAWRTGPVTARGDCSVLDWMVHDLDLASYLTASPMKVVRVRRSVGWVSVTLLGDDGQEVRLRVSEHAQRPRRTLWVDGARYDLCAHGRDLLQEELEAFVSTVRGDTDTRLAMGADICRVMRLVERVLQPVSIAA